MNCLPSDVYTINLDMLILSSNGHKELCLFSHYTWKYWGQTVKVSTFKKSGKVKEACTVGRTHSQ